MAKIQQSGNSEQFREQVPVPASPWNDPPAIFKKLPELDPRTQQKIPQYLCSVCGSVVVNRKTHMKWHNKHSSTNF